MDKFTKGPWIGCVSRFDQNTIGFHISASPHGSIHPVCQLEGDLNGVPGFTPDELDANCRLIAAAPDLLAALIEARDTYIPNDPTNRVIIMMEAVIAKARGQSC